MICSLLTQNQNLVLLTLNGCGLGNEGVAVLARGLRVNRSVQHLELRGNHVGGAGARALAQALAGQRPCVLKVLDLSSGEERARGSEEGLRFPNQVRDVGALELSKALRRNKRVFVDVRGAAQEISEPVRQRLLAEHVGRLRLWEEKDRREAWNIFTANCMDSEWRSQQAVW